MADYNKKSLGVKTCRERVYWIIKSRYAKLYQKPYANMCPSLNCNHRTIIKPWPIPTFAWKVIKTSRTNALKIIVLLYGYDHTQPRTMDEQQDNVQPGWQRAVHATYKSTNYHTEFSYRHPMAVKVYTPDGKELLSLTPPELNSYKIYTRAWLPTRPTRY
jgi:hypothetical protein